MVREENDPPHSDVAHLSPGLNWRERWVGDRSGEPPDLARQPQAAYSGGDPGFDSIGERTIKHATGWPHDSQIFAV